LRPAKLASVRPPLYNEKLIIISNSPVGNLGRSPAKDVTEKLIDAVQGSDEKV
jgi:hypothetical protein